MRRVFFSFDFDDVWRVNQVRKSWMTKGNFESAGFVDAADMEKVKRSTDHSIKSWIDEQLDGTSVTCVLIGSQTSNSKWVKYEIRESIKKGNGLLGVYIHDLKNEKGCTSSVGEPPFSPFSYSCYDWSSQNGYENLGAWIDTAARQVGR